MALDVGVADPGGSGLLPSPRASLRSDGYYWYLYPLIERLRKSHGKYIDLFGNAAFRKGELSLLLGFLNEAQALIESQPASWKVHIGTETGLVKRELYAALERREFVDLIAQLRAVASAAEAAGSSVLFVGD